MQNLTAIIRTVAEEYAEEHNLKIYEVTLRRERTGRVLRINLDGEVTLDECAGLSRYLSRWIDEQPEDFFPFENYTLEVSSLGVDRPLKTAADFEARIGKVCRIETKDKDATGRRRYKGKIQAVTPDSVILYTEEESAEFTINLDNISKAQLELEF